MKPEIEVLSAKIAAHLTQQRAQSLSPYMLRDSGEPYPPSCSYRGEEGRMCAIGCLIDDAHYKSWMEGKAARDALILQSVAESQDISPDIIVSGDLVLSKWQQYHDSVTTSGNSHHSYEDWLDGKDVAKSPTEFHEFLKENFQ